MEASINAHMPGLVARVVVAEGNGLPSAKKWP